MKHSQIKYVPIESLAPYKTNARTHSDKQISQIAQSMKAFGFTNPVLIDETSTIIAGHGRVKAAQQLGLKEVPTLLISHLSEAQKRAYIIADNKLALNAGWDKEILAIEFQCLLEHEEVIDLGLTGFEMAEIDLIVLEQEGEGAAAEDTVPEPAEKAISQLGDLWHLGGHRLYCGNSLEADSYKALLAGQKASMVFTDPPYNVKVDGHVCGSGKIKHREFAMASGEMNAAEFQAFLKQVFQQLAQYSTDGSIHFICMDWRHVGELINAGNEVYSEFKNLCVWNKDNGGMGSLYRSKHELIFVFKNGTAPHINNVELGKHGRYRTNVWDYAGINTMRKGRMDELAMHPTVKPIALCADAILDCSNRGDIVLDAFGGSGSTLMAAERVGRKAYLIELDPLYVDTIIRRWEKKTGKSATLASTNQTFADVTYERHASAREVGDE